VAEKTNIEWADASWNPWHGCIKVSPGCRFCYMYREKKMYGQDPTVVSRSKTTFEDPLKWKRRWHRAIETLLGANNYLWQQDRHANLDAREILIELAHQVAIDPQPKFIFTCSWSDFFITEADAWRAEAWKIIRQTPEFTYLILTKRPDRIARCLPADWGTGYPNVWLGTSAENQKYADQRIPELLKVPAVKRFVSLEPLLGPILLDNGETSWLTCTGEDYSENDNYCCDLFAECGRHFHGIDWVIVGGESGNVARPMEKQWALDIREQCEHAGVDFFFKQWGEWAADAIAESVNLGLKTYDSKRELYKVGAEVAGNLLDGKHHPARPEPVTAAIAENAEVTE
jgi:protein gp37